MTPMLFGKIIRLLDAMQGANYFRYWQTYNAIVYPFYPALVTREQFSQSLFSFLDQRALSKETTGHTVEPDGSWLALVFAVLACGVQFSDDPVKERDLRSRVFSMFVPSPYVLEELDG